MKIFLWIGLFLPIAGVAQKAEIILGPDEIGENQMWTITITVQNDRLREYDNFPDIDGFRKRGTSSQQSTNIINGQISSSHSITMTYQPLRQGTFTLPAFKMKINDQFVSSPGKKIKVGPAVQQQYRDPFRDFFDRNDFFDRGEPEYVDVKDNAFLAVTTNKDEVYAGEGFNMTLSFFTAETDQAPMSWYKLSEQLTEILKKLKPLNCWEENFNIENIDGEPVTIGGKTYIQHKIYQATFYPLNTETITFPAVGLEMIKYKVAKNPSFFGRNRQEDFKTFYSKPKKVRVKELPPHPLRGQVAVGDYYLDEKISEPQLETGRSATYEFNIYGEGNIASIAKPVVPVDKSIEFYEPNIRQNITHRSNRVTGTKSFTYFLIPREPGDYDLKDYFQWVYFNPEKKEYDTLKSQVRLHVIGESKKNESIQSTDMGSFYDQIEDVDNNLRKASVSDWSTRAFQIFILAMLGSSLYLVLRKK